MTRAHAIELLFWFHDKEIWSSGGYPYQLPGLWLLRPRPVSRWWHI